MAVMDFPSSPTNGQTYGQYTYDSSKGAWRVAASNQSAVISSATAPVSPVAGNIWYNTNDGSMYVYYNDGDTSQWVEMRSEVATSQVGLVPIVPTSVTVSSGTATVSTTGLVTVTSATSASLNDCFSASYRNYKVLITITASGTNTMHARLRNSGGQSATNYAGRYMSFAAVTGTTVTTAFDMVGYTTNDFIDATISQPFLAIPTYSQVNALQGGGSAYFTSCVNSNATSYTTLDILKGNGEAFSATIQVYGYK